MTGSSADRHVIVHAHIFKNAGTTFDFSLGRNFGEGFVDHREDDEFLKGRNDYLLDYLASNVQARALSSHSLHFRIQGNDRLQLHPVYFLRHPLARVWSVYRFEKQQTGTNTAGARRAKEMDLNAYVDWYLQEGSPATIRNVHTIFLSGEGPSPDNMDNKYAVAAAYLADLQADFGIVERYSDSMLVLEETLRDYFPDLDLAYIRRNVSAENPGQPVGESVEALLDKLEPDVALRLHELNEFDLSLYQQANARLDAQLSKVSNLEEKRQAFAERCRQLQAASS